MKAIKMTTPVVWKGTPCGAKLSYENRLLSLGSCFSERIGTWLQERSFQVCVNPFGTLYNPLSLAKALDLLVSREEAWGEEDLIYHQERWHSFMHYSRYSSRDKEEALGRINEDFQRGKEALQNADWLLLTLGSAYVYEYRASGQVVANCHKIPEKEFEHRMLSLEESLEAMQGVLEQVFDKNPKLKVVLSVSPIRYLRYSAAENSCSKAVLLLLARALEQSFPNRISYFPSYEIMMDELRDYRFYADDLIHPSSLALKIIRQKLLDSWLQQSDWEILERENKRFLQSQHIQLIK